MQNKTIKKTLICELTEKERREYGISLATTLGDMEEIEAQKKREMDHFKDRIAGLQARADELSRKVRDGKEWREVGCQVCYGVPDKEHKQTVRLDTMVIVQTERMTEADLQLVMPLDVLKDAMDPGDRLGVSMNGELLSEFVKGGSGLGVDDEEEDLMLHDDDDDGPKIVDVEEAKNTLEDYAVDQLLIDLEKCTKLSRNRRLTAMIDEHGPELISRFQGYSKWNEPDKHLLKVIEQRTKALAKIDQMAADLETQPEGGDEY